GVVDARCCAAGRRDERLHGFAAKARAPDGTNLPARPRRRRAGGTSFRAALHSPPPRSRGRDPAPAGERRSRYPHTRARHLYRARSPAREGGGTVGSRPSRRLGDARAGRDRGGALERGSLPLGMTFTFWAGLSCRSISSPAAASAAAAPAFGRG